MQLKLYEITEPSINPSYLLGSVSTAATLTGGGQVLVGSSTTPGLSVPTIEPIVRTVQDCTAGTPAKAGSLLVQQFITANIGGGAFSASITYAVNGLGLTASFPFLSYGAVIAPPAVFAGPATAAVQQNVGGQSLILCSGMGNALIVGTAVVAGNVLVAGSTTATLQTTTATPTAGGVLAIAMNAGTITAAAGSQTVALVKMGGW